MHNIFILLLTLIIPILTPYGYKFVSFADPFLLARDYIMDVQKDYLSLRRLWMILVVSLSFLVLWFVLQKQMVAVISLSISIFSETIDFLLTRKWMNNNRIRPFITVLCNLIDSVLFVALCLFFNALVELNYDIFLDFLVMNVLYLGVFFYRWKIRSKQTQAQ